MYDRGDDVGALGEGSSVLLEKQMSSVNMLAFEHLGTSTTLQSRRYQHLSRTEVDSPVVLAQEPFLRWAGSKRQIVHRLSEFWDPKRFRRYVEPFCGSSVLFFRLLPKQAFLADKNEQLIEVYQVIRETPDLVYRSLACLPKSKSVYIELRNYNPKVLSRLERVVRFLYLNRFCFNGIYRTNAHGHFNVPYAACSSSRIPSLEHFQACADALKNTDLKACDFGTALMSVRERDFVYLDPPYAVESRRVFRQYGAKSFEREDLDRLAKHLRRIDGMGAFFLLSYADCAEIRETMNDWKIRRIFVRRHIAGFAGARRGAYEVLVTNIEGTNNGQ